METSGEGASWEECFHNGGQPRAVPPSAPPIGNEKQCLRRKLVDRRNPCEAGFHWAMQRVQQCVLPLVLPHNWGMETQGKREKREHSSQQMRLVDRCKRCVHHSFLQDLEVLARVCDTEPSW